MSSAGNFTLEVNGPYPCWCELSYSTVKIRFTHNELSDLEYAVKKAMQEARLKLGDMKDEV